jgi:hypothetical protein
VDRVSFSVPRGAFYSLLGPSGCGKTTTLRLIAGFDQPSEGDILLDGVRVNERRPYERNVSTVFQSYALFPHLTVAQNIAFGLEMRKLARAEITRQATAVAVEPDQRERLVDPPRDERLVHRLVVVRHEAHGDRRPRVRVADAEDAPVIGGELTGNPTVRKIGFTGSTAVGKLLMAQCAGQVKKLTLELGGNAPFLIFDDADLDAAVAGAIVCKFRNSGQVCIAANRLLVQDGIHDAFVERYAEAITALRVGAGTEPGVNVGPLIDQQGLDKVVAHVEDARAKGAEVLLGGGRHDLGGLFYEPTLLTGVSDSMAMSQDETFGPVAGIRRFGDEEEGIRLANDTPYGLAAYFYSRDIGRVWRVGEGLEYGIVGVNTGFVSTEVAPFGGIKESGTGREGSKYGIEDWLEIKYLAMGGIDR